ncbi:sigma-70 family RNA polymerase sigma factor [Streptomyces sp. NPDC050523]|uniref:sigma-70 family RNA polymerase sigma factor n=1 Tax=Streptomyces sp. NPDC050523 TaxID=3365622 RepID=UPI00378A53EC
MNCHTVIGSIGAASAREREMRLLYDQHGRDLLSYVRRLLGGDEYKAEDVVQETLLRCWRNGDLGDSLSWRRWLFRVARNLVIDDYRLRTARPQEVDGNTWLDDLRPTLDDADRVLSLLMLKEALKTLSPAHREVLYEMYFTGRTTREVSLLLDIPLGTVKSRLHHALRGLRLALEAHGADGEQPVHQQMSAA